MKIRQFRLDDYEELVGMLYELNRETYQDIRRLSPMYFYYKAVSNWINADKHIVIGTTDDDSIVGFTMSYRDDVSGLTEEVYMGELAYVKPEYRNSRVSYMLYNNVVKVAEELNLNLVSNSRVENGVDRMVEKHFKPKKMFVNFEIGRS